MAVPQISDRNVFGSAALCPYSTLVVRAVLCGLLGHQRQTKTRVYSENNGHQSVFRQWPAVKMGNKQFDLYSNLAAVITNLFFKKKKTAKNTEQSTVRMFLKFK